MCLTALRRDRSLTQKGFEVANGLPFIPTDFAIHELLKGHTVAEGQALQVALGKIRRASGHFRGQLLAIDPHRIKSSTKRLMRRHRFSANEKALKMAQCFFCWTWILINRFVLPWPRHLKQSPRLPRNCWS